MRNSELEMWIPGRWLVTLAVVILSATAAGPIAGQNQSFGTQNDLAEATRELIAKVEGKCRSDTQLIILERAQGSEQVYESALEAAGHLSDGDKLFFCPGVYEVTSPFRISGLSGVEIVGHEASIVSPIDDTVVRVERSRGISIVGLHIVHETGMPCAEDTLSVAETRNIDILLNDLDGSGYTGLFIENSENVLVAGNMIRNSEYGLWPSESPNIKVQMNTFKGNAHNFNGDVTAGMLNDWRNTNTVHPEGNRGKPNIPQPPPRTTRRPTPPSPTIGTAKYKATCPKGIAGCSPDNQCRKCDPSCGDYCQDTGESYCGPDDCMSCPPGQELSVVYGDGTGECGPGPNVTQQRPTRKVPVGQSATQPELVNVSTFKADSSGVLAVAVGPSGDRVATGGWDNIIKLWTDRGLEKEISLAGRGDLILALAFSPDGKRIVSGSRDYETNTQTVAVWDIRAGSPALALRNPPSNFCESVAFSPDGRKILAGCWDGTRVEYTLQHWDARSGAVTFREVGDYGQPVAFSPDSSRFVSGWSGSHFIQMWDSRTGAKQLDFRGVNTESVAFNHDGQLMATGDSDGVIVLWKPHTGEEVARLDGHTDRINAVAFSPVDYTLASAGQDGSIKLWSPGKGSPVARVDGLSPVSSLAYAPDGSRLLSGHEDGSVIVWRTSGKVQTTHRPAARPAGKVAFVTSEAYDGNLGGIAGADAKCQRLANAAGLSGRFKAWISDRHNSPATTFRRANMPYVRTDGVQLAPNWQGLIDRNLDAKLNHDERGRDVGTPGIWTGTNTDGRGEPNYCLDWTSASNDKNGNHGCTSGASYHWTSCGSNWCNGKKPIYCFEQ